MNKDLYRSKDLARIHMAKKELGLDDDAYRTLVRGTTGKDSAGDLSSKQRFALLCALRKLGASTAATPQIYPGRPQPPPPDTASLIAKIEAQLADARRPWSYADGMAQHMSKTTTLGAALTIAALYVETKGCYFGLSGVDPWDINLDARTYRGPWPVVAHPPCQRWGRFSEGSMTKKTETTGDDGGCFEAALRALTLFGGVLEHPAHSKAWDFYGIPKPGKAGWSHAGPNLWVCEVEQGHYGHPARKKTWLLACGPRPADLIWGPCEQRLPAKRLAERGYESARRCGIIANMCSKHRQRTPPEFRDLLLSIAATCGSIQATA